MKPCNILDLGILTEITDDYHEESIHARIRYGILSSTSYWFLEGDTCVCYEAIGRRKYQVHIYSVSRDRRGKRLKDLAIRAGRWMLDNTEATTFINWIEPDRKDLRFFMVSIGAKKIGKIPGTGQILYVSTEGMGIEKDRNNMSLEDI